MTSKNGKIDDQLETVNLTSSKNEIKIISNGIVQGSSSGPALTGRAALMQVRDITIHETQRRTQWLLFLNFKYKTSKWSIIKFLENEKYLFCKFILTARSRNKGVPPLANSRLLKISHYNRSFAKFFI